jgi:hypothetical protein
MDELAGEKREEQRYNRRFTLGESGESNGFIV